VSFPALAAADHFLHAWQTGDTSKTAWFMLSDGHPPFARAPTNWNSFSPAATDRAFEITRGHGHQGRYSFQVVLVTPRGSSHVTRKFSEIVLVETGKNDWVVDKLP
jgi:hypothetical protein